MRASHDSLRRLLWILPVILLAAGCASIGNPGGGPRDEDAPRFVRSNPAPGATGVSRQRVTIDFDEIVNVKDAFSKVVVSPPGERVPKVSSQGRRVTVSFDDTLRANTTYTIDFGDAIEDNNEGNKLQNFTFTFATGPVIDTLRISGMVLGAADLEPQQGMLVGVHDADLLADTTLATLLFLRMAKTDDRGRFIIRGLKPGRYSLFALGDIDNDFRRANPEEPMAFLGETIVPSSLPVIATDTIFDLLTGKVDTVVSRAATRFLPDDVLLRSFTAATKARFLTGYERIDSTRLQLIFNAPSTDLPRLSVAGAPGMRDWYELERSAGNDTLTYWLRPRSLIATDTLRVSAGFLRTDSASRLVPGVDTLRFLTVRPQTPKKPKKRSAGELRADSLAAVAALTIPISVKSSMSQDVNLPLYLEFATPLASLDTAAFHLEVKADTLWKPVGERIRPERADSLHPRLFRIRYPWRYGTTYRLTADTLAAVGIYGQPTRPLSHEFKVKGEDEYCSLSLTLLGLDPATPAFVQLLSTSDAPLRSQQVRDGRVLFRYLSPGKYYVRLYEDLNGNGRFDTGDYDSLRQPDVAYYYPKAINIKKNWDKSETWDVFATAVDRQKPAAILKNKPAADKRNRKRENPDEEEEEEDEIFDPTRNPFDPNDSRQNRQKRQRL